MKWNRFVVVTIAAIALVAGVCEGQDAWIEVHPGGAGAPPGRAWHVFENNRSVTDGKSFLFGGHSHEDPAELWIFDSGDLAWTSIVPSSRKNPEQCNGCGAAYDSAQDLFVIFGGGGGRRGGPPAATSDETWIYDVASNRWSNRIDCRTEDMAVTKARGGRGMGGGGRAGTRPPGRWFPAMAYNPTRAETIVFGGENLDERRLLADSWRLRISGGKACWMPVGEAGPSPPARYFAELVYMPPRGTLVLYGGTDLSTNLVDMWEFDGTEWAEIEQSGGPALRDHGMAFDERSGRLLVFGGQLNPLDDDQPSDATYVFDFVTGSWTEISPAVSPAARSGAPLTFDRELQVSLFFGGIDPSGLDFYDDTWAIISP